MHNSIRPEKIGRKTVTKYQNDGPRFFEIYTEYVLSTYIRTKKRCQKMSSNSERIYSNC